MSSIRIPARTIKTVVLLACGGLLTSLSLGVSGCARVQSQIPEASHAEVPAPEVPPAPPTYAPGTLVAGVDVGGETLERAAHLVRYHLQAMEGRKINLHYGKRTFARTWAELGVRPDTDAMLQKAWAMTDVPLEVTADLAAAKRSITRAANALRIRPVAPRFVGEPGEGVIKDGKAGRKVNVHASALLLQETLTLDPDAATSPLVVVADEPDFTTADMERIRRPVVKYATNFNPGERSRTHNLRLVAQRLNGALVKPGQTFSFNEWVGERRPEDGFREAIVFKEGKMVKDTGGGLCQVSSTLYNVALLAGLPIVERRNHSLTVAYVPLGRDAMVYWGQQDLRFRNDTDTPLYIRAVTGRRTLTIEAWGSAPLEREVRVTSSSARRGGKAFAEVHRTVVDNGIKRRERISSDMYSTTHAAANPPRRAQRARG